MSALCIPGLQQQQQLLLLLLLGLLLLPLRLPLLLFTVNTRMFICDRQVQSG